MICLWHVQELKAEAVVAAEQFIEGALASVVENFAIGCMGGGYYLKKYSSLFWYFERTCVWGMCTSNAVSISYERLSFTNFEYFISCIRHASAFIESIWGVGKAVDASLLWGHIFFHLGKLRRMSEKLSISILCGIHWYCCDVISVLCKTLTLEEPALILVVPSHRPAKFIHFICKLSPTSNIRKNFPPNVLFR